MGVTRHPLCPGHTSRRLRSIPPDERLVQLLESGWAHIAIDQLAARFYEIFFCRHPQLRGMFVTSLKEQQAKIGATLQLVVEQLRSPHFVFRTLRELGRRHAVMGVRPEHYPLVVDALSTALAELAGDRWSAEMRAEWQGALNLMADMMIEGHAQSSIGKEHNNPGARG